MCSACISSINQHCFEGERGVLIKQSKKYCKCSKTFSRDCSLKRAATVIKYTSLKLLLAEILA